MVFWYLFSPTNLSLRNRWIRQVLPVNSIPKITTFTSVWGCSAPVLELKSFIFEVKNDMGVTVLRLFWNRSCFTMEIRRSTLLKHTSLKIYFDKQKWVIVTWTPPRIGMHFGAWKSRISWSCAIASIFLHQQQNSYLISLQWYEPKCALADVQGSS